MKTEALVLAFAGLAATAIHAATEAAPPMPQPSPEMQRLDVWHGQWTYTGEVLATPVGPASTFTGTMTGGAILNGFATEHIYIDQGPSGPIEAREWCWYDASRATYAYTYLADGYIELGTFTMDGTVCAWEAQCVWGATPFTMRGTETVSPDKQTMTRSAEITTDGKTWKPYLRMTLNRLHPREPAATIEAELLRLENAWAAAYLARDVKALGELEADDWICTTADGEVLSKADDIRDIANATYVATVFEMADLKVQVHGDTAVITGRQTEKATYKGEDASAVYRITDVWMRRNGRWQAIASHLCKVGTP